MWTRTFGGNSRDNANSVIETSDQGYLIAGSTRSYGVGNDDCWLVKTDFHGDTLWTRTFGGNSRDNANSVIETSDQSYLIAGRTESYGAGDDDYWLVKTDFQGDTLWTRTYGGSEDESVSVVIETSDQGYLLAGRTESYGAGDDDYWLVKTDTHGDIIWTQTYGGSEDELVSAIIETSDQGYLLAGSTTSFGVLTGNAWLIKTDSQGNTTSTSLKRDEMELPFSSSIHISPNPMNNSCNFAYTISERSPVSVDIYNVKGARVWTQVFGEQVSGTYNYLWNARDQNGDNLGSGVYILQVSTKSWRESRKLILLK